MSVYTVELDGKQYDIEGDRPPTEEEARSAISSYSNNDTFTKPDSTPKNRLPVEKSIVSKDNTQDNSAQNLGILGDILSHPIANRNVIADAMANSGKQILNNFADLGDNTINTVKSIPQIPLAILNSVVHPVITVKAVGGAIGNKINEYNSVNKISEKVSNDPLGFSSDAINAAIIGKGAYDIGKSGINLAKNSPILKAYNDRLVSNTVNSIGNKITSALKPVQMEYKNLTEPFLEKPVDAETFQKALSVVPKDVRPDLIEKYGSSILDSSGNPTTTVGNLQRMELGLKEDIMQPKFGASINASSFDTAKAAKVIKDLRLEQYPTQVKDSILELDNRFGPLINASKEILPKVSNQAGVANTKTVFNWFNDPANAGKRDYLVSDLKRLGIDLTPEVSLIKNWVARQGQKKFLRTAGGIIGEGTAIGKLIRGH